MFIVTEIGARSMGIINLCEYCRNDDCSICENDECAVKIITSRQLSKRKRVPMGKHIHAKKLSAEEGTLPDEQVVRHKFIPVWEKQNNKSMSYINKINKKKKGREIPRVLAWPGESPCAIPTKGLQ